MKWENYEHEDVFAEERKAYPREQYEADKAKLIAEGVDPRLILSYTATLSSMAWEAELEREFEEAESYDEAMAELEREEAEREIAAEVAERDAIIEHAEMAEEAALSELEAFGCIEFEDDEPMIIDTRDDAHAYLTARVDALDDELEESGVADALDWERWDEFENALYCLAEFECAA